MTHPEDLLAGHVDGTLSDRERAVVDAHLETCATCREEVALARRAVAALERLEDVPVPLGVTERVIAEASSAGPRRTANAPRWQWAAGLAAAAAIVAVVAVSLGGGAPQGPTLAEGGSPTRGAGVESAVAAADVPLELQPDVNYAGDDGVLVLAREALDAFERSGRSASPTTDAEDAGGAQGGSTPTAAAALSAAETTDPAPALRCLERAGVPPPGAAMTLVRLVDTRYNDRAVFLAVFLQGPGGGQPPDRVVVWAVARRACEIVNFLSATFDALEATGTS